MTIDIFTLQALTRELAPRIRGARIDKITQPGAERLVLRLWTGREKLRLALDVSPQQGRIELATAGDLNPSAPPRFCQLLRARLQRLGELTCDPRDRLLILEGASADGTPCTLVVELTGAEGDLLLLQQGRIVDSLRRRQEAERDLRPGAVYSPPQLGATIDLADPQVPQLWAEEEGRTRCLQQVAPMTPLLASMLDNAIDRPALQREVVTAWQEGAVRPAIGLWQGKKMLTVLPPMTAQLTEPTVYATVAEAVQAYYAEDAGSFAEDAGQLLRRHLDRQVQRCRKRLDAIARDAAEVRKADHWQLCGQALLANLHQVRKGQVEVRLPHPVDPSQPELVIPLDPASSPVDNAQALFKRAKKLGRGLEHQQRRLEETAQELAWLESVRQALTEVRRREELEQIEAELAQARALPPEYRVRRTARVQPRRSLRNATSPGGFRISWGTNNQQNDLLLRELAQPHDLWYHAHDLPGGHVVLHRTAGQVVPEADRLWAAGLAAGYSRGQGDRLVEVKETEVRYLRRPGGGAPGFVLVDRFHTLRVAPFRLESMENQ